MNLNRLKKLSGDASFRYFYRSRNGIVVFCDKNKKSNLLDYDAINKILIKKKVVAPSLISQNYKKNSSLPCFECLFPQTDQDHRCLNSAMIGPVAGMVTSLACTKIIFALTHNYSAYPMLREAKELVKKNKIGKIKLINVEYHQGYTVAVKKKDEKDILKWRLDKKM